MGEIEDELRIDVQDALAGLDGLEVRRMFSGWGFYRRSMLFAACWDGEFRWRIRREGRWVYVPVDRSLLEHPEELTACAAEVIAVLDAEPAATKARRRR